MIVAQYDCTGSSREGGTICPDTKGKTSFDSYNIGRSITYDDAFFVKSRDQRNQESRKALRTAFENLLDDGHKDLYYQVGEGQLGYDGEGTVDGTHPTDLGFWRQAQVYLPLIEIC